MSDGFALNLDLDLTLEVEDAERCMIYMCSREAVMLGIIATPCNCPQPLCLAHYDREKPKWRPGDPIHCHLCPKRVDNGGYFVKWERVR